MSTTVPPMQPRPPRRHWPLPVVACSLTVVLVGCAGPTTGPFVASQVSCTAPGREMTVDTLYFGTDRGNAAPVSDAQWRAFVDSIVTPRFPAGLTHWRADGQWRNAQGVILRETSFVLRIAHDGTREGDTSLRDIDAAWRRMYAQESVMRVRSQACVSF